MEIWKQILSKLEEEKKVILLLVCSHSGSSPGKQGFKMMVSDDGELFGSVGGGRTEFQMVDLARSYFKKEFPFAPFIKNQVHREKVEDSSGMVCAGEQKVVFYPMESSYIAMIKSILEYKSGVLKIDSDKISFDKETISDKDFIFENIVNWRYLENVNRKSKIYIVGGGHVGLSVSQLFSTLDFEVNVFENRANINTFDKNNFADKKQLIDYNDINDYLEEGKDSYIVILTHGHKVDKLVLGKLLQYNYGYIGLLGSKYKVKKMFEEFVKEGMNRKDLYKVDAPIGLEIGSKTPAEIAVSIAAKIISIRNLS